MPTYNWDMVSAISRNHHLPKLKDQLFLSNALWFRWRDKLSYEITGGPKIVAPLSFSPEGGGGMFFSGNDKFDTTIRNPIKAAEYFWKNGVVSAYIDLDEELAASGPGAVLNLVASKRKIQARTAQDLFGTSIFNAGTNPKAPTGLQFALSDNIVSTAQTYGGITCGGSAPSADANGWWQHNSDATAYTCGSSGDFMQAGAANTPVGVMTARANLRGGRSPSLIVSNWGAWTDYHNSLSKNERYDRPQQQTDMAKAGFTNLMYRNMPWVTDERAPRGGASTYIEKVYLIDESSLHFFVDPRLNFKDDGWVKPHDQAVRGNHLMHRFEMGFDERRTSGVISNVNTSAVLAV